MVNFLLLFQKSLIFPFEEICAALKKPLDFFSLVFSFSTFGALFLCRIALEPAITMNTLMILTIDLIKKEYWFNA